MTRGQDDRIGAALRGANPTVLARMPGGFAVIGDVQWLPGYCVPLTDEPSVERLSELRARPVWLCPEARWSDPATALGPRHDALRAAITERLAALCGAVVASPGGR